METIAAGAGLATGGGGGGGAGAPAVGAEGTGDGAEGTGGDDTTGGGGGCPGSAGAGDWATAAWRGCRRRRSRGAASLNDPQGVLPGDAPTGSRPFDFGFADAVLGQQPTHDRGQDERVGVLRSRDLARRRRDRHLRSRRWRGLSRRWRWRWRWRSSRRLGDRHAGGGRATRYGTLPDHGQGHTNLDRLALGNQDLGQHARRRRGHLGVDLVGRHLVERLVALDGVAHGFHPPGDRALGHRLAQLRHDHVSQREVPFRSVPASSRRRLRTGTGAAE